MKTYKIGLIGFGFIGKVHAKAYHSIPYCYIDPTGWSTGNYCLAERSNPGSGTLARIVYSALHQ